MKRLSREEAERLSSEPRRFACGSCPRKFATADGLRSHMRAAHPEISAKARCPDCGKKVRAKGLWMHRRDMHRKDSR